jgi:hypothetical protein
MHEKFDNNLMMEDKVNMIETLLERVTELGKTSFELYKLKTVEKTAEVISTVVPHAIVYILFSSFMLFLNLGLALWLGQIIGNTFYGFFVVAAFYAVIAVFVHLFFHKWLKRVVNEFIIKLSFKKESDE